MTHSAAVIGRHAIEFNAGGALHGCIFTALLTKVRHEFTQKTSEEW